MSATRLILGVGNPDRGDDAAGIQTVRKLRGRSRVEEVKDCSRLIELWEAEDDVTVVDATVSGAEPGTITRFDGLSDSLPAGNFQSTHSLGLAEILELARVLGRLPRRLTIFGIEASSFAHGAGLTPRVREAVESLAMALQREAG